MRLQTKALVGEYLLAIYMLSQCILSSYIPRYLALLGFIALTLVKYKMEGVRLNFILFIFAEILLLTAHYIFFHLSAFILIYITITKFPIYELPPTTGQYKVGYRKFQLSTKTYGAVYYPTTETTQDVNYSKDTEGWERFADIIIFYANVRKARPLPKLFYQLAFSSLDHENLGVNLNSKLVKSEQGFPVIIFSHGLAANIHSHSVQMKEWASHGFIIVSVDHPESIPVPVKSLDDYDEYVRLRAEQLADRKDIFLQALDFVYNQNKVRQFFEDSEMTINYKKIFLAGHSFGGATVCETAHQEERVTGGLILYDPWLAPCSEHVYQAPHNKPVLLLRSETFDKSERFKLEPWKYIQAHEKGQGLVVSGYFKGSAHHSSADLILQVPRELTMLKKINGMHDLDDQILGHRDLTLIFLNAIMQQTTEEGFAKDKNFKTHVLNKFREHLKKSAKRDFLQVDELLMAKN